MKVRDLIAMLQLYNQDAEIIVHSEMQRIDFDPSAVCTSADDEVVIDVDDQYRQLIVHEKGWLKR